MKKSELVGMAVKGLMAASVLSMVVSAPVLAADKPAADAGSKVHCQGVNACKGQGACKGAGHACAGKNACKGKGVMMMNKDECAKKGGTVSDAVKK